MSGAIEAQIRQFISDHFPSAHRAKLDNQDSLLENGIIDSLGVLDLVSFMEETFAITIMDEELLPENFQTIERLAKFVETKNNGKMSS